ncbi:unnamed protein product [Heligmosomoides polygyrus]|uniref:Uncharacterized protein n=1 Tax=Heligmosomoides polygyrus TaxID=6339 RepID=A0A183GRJ1_HELPZ|nr:unnamed protein product [Heligmosomoides polygyrus]
MVCKNAGINGDRTNDVAPDEEEHYPYATTAAGGALLRDPDDSPFSHQVHRTACLWDLKVQANLTDGVVVSAKDMAVPSKTSFAQLLGFGATPNLCRMASLRTRLKRVTPAVHRSIFVSIILRRFSISFVTGQHSAPYFATGRTLSY